MPIIIDSAKNKEKTKPKITVIEPRKKYHKLNDTKKLRVAAYCRVSTDSDEQEVSYESQCLYYEQYINNNPNYELIEVFSDEGISGTSMAKRTGFMNMMKLARQGKIDMIVTKSITRFARNTVDSLSCIRELKELEVDVFFELENLHTKDGGELLLTIHSTMAQESSQEKSESVKWGYQRQFEKGNVYMGQVYGYIQKNGEIIINENEAEIIKEIFIKYLSGMSDSSIAQYLTEQGVPTKRGNSKWQQSVIKGILKNEKYTGNAIMGKTYNVDFLHPKRLKNNGEATMYYIENSHPAIISKEMFEEVQVERQRRIKNSKTTISSNEGSSNGRFNTVNALADRIFCSDCGALYRRAVWTKRNKEKEPVWRCKNRLKNGKHACLGCVTIKEEKLFKELSLVIKELTKDRDEVIKDVAQKVSEYTNPKDLIQQKALKEKCLNDIDSKISRTIEEGNIMISRGVQDEQSLKEHLEKHYKEKKKLLQELEEVNARLELVRASKEEKVIKILKNIEEPVSEIKQEELAVFILKIIVSKNYLEVITTENKVFQIPIEKVK